jgi:FKBP-type peptidyl-prolyl cis-trans isomerase 2
MGSMRLFRAGERLSEIAVNEEKSIRLQPEEAFGPVDPNRFQEVQKPEIPAAG